MSVQIWKFPLKLVPTQTLRMPERSIMRHIGVQEADGLCLWAEVLTENDKETVTIEMYGTGHAQIMTGRTRAYLGTIIMEPYVWHFYQEHINP